MHVMILWWFQKRQFHEIYVGLLKIWIRFVLGDVWYFQVKRVNVFHANIFDIINLLFNCCFNFWIFCFNFYNFSVVDTHIFNPFFNVCGNCRKVLLIINWFYQNLFAVYFINLVSFDWRSVSDLRLTSSFPIFFDYESCFLSTDSVIRPIFQIFLVVSQRFYHTKKKLLRVCCQSNTLTQRVFMV